jgi:hypothetical protein
MTNRQDDDELLAAAALEDTLDQNNGALEKIRAIGAELGFVFGEDGLTRSPDLPPLTDAQMAEAKARIEAVLRGAAN